MHRALGRRWRQTSRPRRVLICLLVAVLGLSGGGLVAAEVFIASVDLPADPVMPQASTLLYRDGRTILTRVGVTDHSDVPLSRVPIEVRRAVLAAEDRQFAEHGGVSVRGVIRALVSDIGGGREGASTITQQYARNAFLTQDFSVGRKAREFGLAVQLERRYTKDQILERYLNTIYYGRGAYGIAAAANAYFGVPPERLNAAQGVVLAAVIKDPSNFDPAVDPQGAKDRFAWIADAAAALKWLPGDLAYPKVAKPSGDLDGPNGLVVDHVERELAKLGITSQDLHTKGLSITTTVDKVSQRTALQLIKRQLGGKAKDLRAALVALDPKTGGVRAYYGNNHGSGYFDFAAVPHPSASTFKPIVLTAALDSGIGYRSRWDGTSPRVFSGRPPLANPRDAQCPDCTLKQSMVDSLNTPFYAVTERIGADRVREVAVRLGVSDTYAGAKSMVDVKGDPEPGRTRTDIGIGRYPVSPADMASVYGTLAADGKRNSRYFVESVTDPNRTELYHARPVSKVAVKPGTAGDMSAVLSSVVEGRKLAPGRRPAAGKGGSEGYGDGTDVQDVWMAGYTAGLATAIWLGNERPGPIRDRSGRSIKDDSMAAKLWQRFVTTAQAGLPAEPLPTPVNAGRDDVGDAGHTGTRPGVTRAVPGGPVVQTANAGKRLALTFDDGPSEYTPQVLDLLAQYRIKAVFCMVGVEAVRHPDLVRKVVEAGHGLCNHSWKHDDLGTMSAEQARTDIERTSTALTQAAPGHTPTWFRAPFGDWGKSAKVGKDLGMTPLGWSVDPQDWTLPGTEAIRERVMSQSQPRGIVLVHDGGGVREQTIAALRALIPELLADGWTFDLPQTTVQTPPPPKSAAAKPKPDASASPSPSAGAAPPEDDASPPAELEKAIADVPDEEDEDDESPRRRRVRPSS